MSAKPDLARFRNIGVIAHIDAGKTTTTEHMLYYAGAIHRLGGVDEGTTETDWMELEKQKGITIQSACVPFQWGGMTCNLIDTPGHVDFTAEVERSLRVLDGAIVVFDAQKGVEAQSETVWRQADKYGVPRLVFINKMDIVGANFANTLVEIRERLQGRPVPVVIPVGAGSPKDSDHPFSAVIDLLDMQMLTFEASTPDRADGKAVKRQPIPPEHLDAAQRARDQLIDVLTEVDDDDRITSAYLAGEPLPAEALILLLRKRTLKNEIQPVFCGSGREHIGIQPLLDGIVRYLPSPLDRPPIAGQHPKKDVEVLRRPSIDEPFAALVFKIQADQHGELYYLRLYSGQVKANSRVYNPGREAKEFLTKLYHVHADPSNKDALDIAYAGDIVAAIGPKESITGDTLCDPQHPLLLERISFAETVVSMSIEPESSADKAKLEQVLTTLAREDPTFRWQVDPETGQTLMSGMGVLHLEVKTHRIKNDFRVKARVGKPRVSYRETLRRPMRLWGECHRFVGGAHLSAKVELALEHLHGSQPITFINDLPEAKRATFPATFLAAIEQGVRSGLASGEVGYPVIDVAVRLCDAQIHETESNEVAFQIAASEAVTQALRDNVVLLEPVMHVEVTVPEQFLGPVTADLQARRAEISEVNTRGNLRTIVAQCPLAAMFDYADAVRSLTQGRASYTMEPRRYAPAPYEVLRRLLGMDE